MLSDIVEFYTSISEDLLKQALEFAATYTAVTEKEVDISLHSRKSLLFAGEKIMDKEMACLTSPWAVSMAMKYANWWEHLRRQR